MHLKLFEADRSVYAPLVTNEEKIFLHFLDL